MSENNTNIEQKVFEACKTNGTKTLSDPDKFEEFLRQLEEKLKRIPALGEGLAYVPILASLARSYYKKEYTEIPVGTIAAIIGALAYFVLPIDLIPDSIPIIGHVDDAAVIAACVGLAIDDIKAYEKWRDNQDKLIGEKK